MEGSVLPSVSSDWSTAEELGSDVLGAARAESVEPVDADGGELSAEEIQTLAAIAARVFPPTDTPGAIDIGAVDYVVRSLAGPYGSSLATYRRGLRALDATCRARFGASFARLSEQRQDETLRALQTGGLEDVPDGSDFFALVRRHILEGVFCEPTYGGNRDLIGWSLVGFPGQRYGYRDPYINQVIGLPPIAVEGPPGAEDY